MFIKVNIESTEYTIREIDPDDSWDAGETGLRYLGCTAAISQSSGDEEIDFECAPGDTVYVLIEHYTDGCTFGSSEYLECKGVFQTEAEALERSRSIDTGHGYFGSHICFHVEPCRV